MGVVLEIRNLVGHWLRQVVGPVIGASLMVYVIYHAVQGNHGLIAYWQLVKQVGTATSVAAAVGDERARLERRVRLLHPQSLDPDMLEERARIMLGYAHPADIVLMDRPEDGRPVSRRQGIR